MLLTLFLLTHNGFAAESCTVDALVLNYPLVSTGIDWKIVGSDCIAVGAEAVIISTQYLSPDCPERHLHDFPYDDGSGTSMYSMVPEDYIVGVFNKTVNRIDVFAYVGQNYLDEYVFTPVLTGISGEEFNNAIFGIHSCNNVSMTIPTSDANGYESGEFNFYQDVYSEPLPVPRPTGFAVGPRLRWRLGEQLAFRDVRVRTTYGYVRENVLFLSGYPGTDTAFQFGPSFPLPRSGVFSSRDTVPFTW